MLRAAMRHAGGVRIDHAMGLAGCGCCRTAPARRDGVYLHFPLDDMLRLIRLESVRHKAIVLGEDLGTLPEGFQDGIARGGMLGMRVLWFERAKDGGFTAPSGWDHGAVAMTSTHDLATVAGWWTGNDIARREQAGVTGTLGPGPPGARARPRDAVVGHAAQRRRTAPSRPRPSRALPWTPPCATSAAPPAPLQCCRWRMRSAWWSSRTCPAP